MAEIPSEAVANGIVILSMHFYKVISLCKTSMSEVYQML